METTKMSEVIELEKENILNTVDKEHDSAVENYCRLIETESKIVSEARAAEKAKLEAEEMKKDGKRKWVTICISGATLMLSVYAVIKSFKFDEVSNFTSTGGRSTISSIFKNITH